MQRGIVMMTRDIGTNSNLIVPVMFPMTLATVVVLMGNQLQHLLIILLVLLLRQMHFLLLLPQFSRKRHHLHLLFLVTRVWGVMMDMVEAKIWVSHHPVILMVAVNH